MGNEKIRYFKKHAGKRKRGIRWTAKTSQINIFLVIFFPGCKAWYLDTLYVFEN